MGDVISRCQQSDTQTQWKADQSDQWLVKCEQSVQGEVFVSHWSVFAGEKQVEIDIILCLQCLMSSWHMEIAKENILHKKFFINIVQLISILKWTYVSCCLGPRHIPRPGCYRMVIKLHRVWLPTLWCLPSAWCMQMAAPRVAIFMNLATGSGACVGDCTCMPHQKSL